MIGRVEYLALKARVKEELDNIKRLEKALRKLNLYPSIKTDNLNGLPLNDEISCRVIGSYLHDYYCGLEKVFVHIAKSFEETLPTGNQWHRDLLADMALDIPGVRTAPISKRSMTRLDALRGFRHIFRNAYGFNIDPVRELQLLENLSQTSASINKDIKNFFEQMDEYILK